MVHKAAVCVRVSMEFESRLGTREMADEPEPKETREDMLLYIHKVYILLPSMACVCKVPGGRPITEPGKHTDQGSLACDEGRVGGSPAGGMQTSEEMEGEEVRRSVSRRPRRQRGRGLWRTRVAGRET